MRSFGFFVTVALMVTSLLMSSQSLSKSASWKLDSDQSSIHFSSTKNHIITEIHSFGDFDVTYLGKNVFAGSIQLASVDTAIPIRNERMKTMLFNVAQFSTANFQLTVPADAMSEDDAIVNVEALVKLTLNGVTRTLPMKATVTKAKNGQHVVSNAVPLLVDAEQFNLTAGIEALRTIAGLKHINRVVPVSFYLVFAP